MSRVAVKTPRTRRASAPAHRVPLKPLHIRQGKKTVGVVISLEDFELFERLIAEEEDRIDLAAARKALREPDGATLEELKAELGL